MRPPRNRTTWGIALLILLVAGASPPAPVGASDLNTMNESEQSAGAPMNKWFAAAPASCTSTGMDGQDFTTLSPVAYNCDARGDAAATAASDGAFFSDATWSEIEQNALGLPVSASSSGGESWVPITCFGPECGHMLKGDILAVDVDDDGIADVALNDQFSWGETSRISGFLVDSGGNVVDLGRMDNLVVDDDGEQRLAATPAGATRMLLRQAIGSTSFNANGGVVSADTCNGRLWLNGALNPKCLDGAVDGEVDLAAESEAAGADPTVFGRCDPDRFYTDPGGGATPAQKHAAAIEAQHAFDNCLMMIAGTALTGPTIRNTAGAAVSPLDRAMDLTTLTGSDIHGVAIAANQIDLYLRTEWVDQTVITEMRGNSLDDTLAGWMNADQDLYQNVHVRAGFEKTGDLYRASYQNDLRLVQHDFDPMGANNIVGGVEDTYTNIIELAISSASRKWHCNPANAAANAKKTPDADCADGTTNTTLDAFWGEEIVRDALWDAQTDAVNMFIPGTTTPMAVNVMRDHFNQDLGFWNTTPGNPDAASETVKRTGVTQTQHMSQLYSQDVEGYLFSCLDCDTPELIGSGGSHYFDYYLNEQPVFIPYSSSWHTVPTITHAPSL